MSYSKLEHATRVGRWMRPLGLTLAVLVNWSFSGGASLPPYLPATSSEQVPQPDQPDIAGHPPGYMGSTDSVRRM